MKKSGIYIVQLKNEAPMPVTRDPRYVATCAKVNRDNIKVGKAKDLSYRETNYWKEFDRENVYFEPLVETDDIVTAETVILKALRQYRKRSPKGGRLEWLEGISYEDVKITVFASLDEKGISYTIASLENQ